MDNCKFYCIFIGFLFLGTVVASSSECRGMEEPSRFILCYTDSPVNFKTDLACRCSHLVVPLIVNTTQNNANITLNEEIVAYLKTSNSQNGGRLRRILSLTMSAEDFSPTSVQSIVSSVARMIDDLLLEGVEIHWQHPSTDENSKKDKTNLVLFMKELHAVLQEKVIVISTPSSITQMNSTNVEDMEIEAIRPLILLRLPTSPEQLVKSFDLKPLVRTVDLFVVSTHNIEDSSNVTYHHSRLMGISDILNTDSILDLVISLGVSSDRLVAAVPTFAVQFRLRDVQQNLPGSHIFQGPTHIPNEQLYSIMKQGNWTIERDDDLTGAYAYSEEGDWIAFDDEMAAQIKAKYFLLRDIAGVAMMPSNTDEKGTHDEDPSQTAKSVYLSTAQVYYEQFLSQESGERTRRQLAKALRDDLSSVATTLSSPLYNDRVRASPYRIVRIVARSGETSVLRQPLESSLQCSRQGYYRHPEDCGRFYRCVKFDQFVDDFTVFEYDCPEGLVFDERYEVCTWPSQAAPCGGSSEIRPVPMNRFVCPGEGYFADPENCRWFFACRDYAKDGVTFTQYEFRCPFGLLFDEKNLLCNWPWLVPQCAGGVSLSGSIANPSNVVKSEERLEKKLSPIPLGSPGYLSGKLITGEGLYKDPRPAHYGESVVSVGCMDCQSAGMVVKELSPGSGKQTKLVLAIPAATIAGESTPVRIIVASPAYSDDQHITSTASPSYSKPDVPHTETAYDSNAKSSVHDSNTPTESTAIYQSQKHTDSLTLSGSSDPYVSYVSSGDHGKDKSFLYSVADNKAQLPSYSQADNKYDAYNKVTDPIGPPKPDDHYSYKDTLVREIPISALGKPGKDELTSTPYYLVKSGNGDAPGPERNTGNGKEKDDFGYYSLSGLVEPAGHQGKPSSLLSPSDSGAVGYSGKYFDNPIPFYEVSSSQFQDEKIQSQIYTADMSNYKAQHDPIPIYSTAVKASEYVTLITDSAYSAPAYSISTHTKEIPITSSGYSAPAFTAPTYTAPAYTAPAHTAPAYTVPAYTAPSYTAPVYTAPAYTAPAYTAPAYTAPSYTAPVYTAPAYTAPAYTAPVYTAPVYTAPAYTAPAYTAPAYTAPAYTAPAYTAPAYTAPAYTAPAYTKPGYTVPAHNAPAHTAPAHTAPAHTAPAHTAPAYTAPAYTASVYTAPAYTAPAYSPPVYSNPDYVALTYAKKAPEYGTTASPVYSATTYTEKAPEYKTPTTAAPVYSAPAYTEKTPTTTVPVYSFPSYNEKVTEYKTPTTAAPVFSTPAYSKKVTEYKAPATAAPVYFATIYTEKATGYKTPTTAPPVDSAPAYTEKITEYKTPTTSVPVYSSPVYTEKVTGYKTPSTTAAYTEKASGFKTSTTAASVYSAPAYTEKVTGYRTPTTAAPVFLAPAYTEKTPTLKTSATPFSVSSTPVYTGLSLVSVHDSVFPIYEVSSTQRSIYDATAPIYELPLIYDAQKPVYKTPTQVTTPFVNGGENKTDQYNGLKKQEAKPLLALPYVEGTSKQDISEQHSHVQNQSARNELKTEISSPGEQAITETYIQSNSTSSIHTEDQRKKGYNGTGGVTGTRGSGGVSGTRGSKGAMRESVYRNPVATGYSGLEYNPALDRSNAESYGKNRITHSSISRYPSDYETSSRSRDETFGLKDNVKSRGKNVASRLLVNKSTVGTNGNKGSDPKQQATETLTGLASRNNSRKGESNPYRKVEEPLSFSLNHGKILDSLMNGEGIISYGDKKVTVKVPSTNKAALLDKWATFNPSVIETEVAITEQKDSIGGSKSSQRHRIKGKIYAKSQTQELTSSIVQPNVKLIDSSGSSTSPTLNKNDGKILTGINGSEYGHRYLEKITIAQATAKNETLGPEVCVRAGLFRHPSDCQKFYECYWDRWIHQYTVHIFKCPIHLVYDDYITACNWPLDGPACVPHEAVKLYAEMPSLA